MNSAYARCAKRMETSASMLFPSMIETKVSMEETMLFRNFKATG